MDVRVKREGITLRGRLDKPELDKCPIAILFHGFSGNRGYKEEDLLSIIAKKLKDAGIASIRFDFNGHGKSDGKFVEMDVFKEIEDAISILSYVRSLEFVTDIYIIGHSQGGVVGGMLSGYYADVISKLVLLAPAATLKEDAKKGFCMGITYDTHHIPDAVTINNGALNIGGHYFRIAKHLPIYEVTKAFKGSALVIHGLKDTVVDPKASLQYQKVMACCSLELMEHLDHAVQGEDQSMAISKIVAFLKAD